MAKKILLVEDEPNIIASLTFLLERSGYDVDTRDNGKAALEAVLADPPDVLVLDVMLPGLDGFEVLRRVRDNPETAALAVLMLTAKGQREDRKTAVDHGADMFITKPFSNTELVEAVNTLASRD